MTTLNYFYLTSGIFFFLLGYYVFLKDPKRRVNLIFFLFSLAATLWYEGSFLKGFLYPNLSLEQREQLLLAGNWKILVAEDIGWLGISYLSPLFLHLVILITKQRAVFQKKISIILIYLLPTLVNIWILIYDFYFDLQLHKIVKIAEIFQHFFVDILFSLYFVFFLILGLIFLIKRYTKLKSYQERTQARYFIIGALIPGIIGAIFLLLSIIKINIYYVSWLLGPFFTLGYLFVSLGVLRHGLFIDYREILETIFKRLAELVIVTDKEGLILLTNEITLAKLNFKEEEISSQNISNFFKTKEAWPSLKEKLKKQGEALEEKLVFLTKEKEEIPFLTSISQAKEGIILVGRDIKELLSYQEKLKEEVEKRTKELKEAKTILEVKVKARTKELQELADSLEEQVKQRTKELQKRVEELERFHRLTVGRERRMIELKKEIEDLKKHLMMRKEKI